MCQSSVTVFVKDYTSDLLTYQFYLQRFPNQPQLIFFFLFKDSYIY